MKIFNLDEKAVYTSTPDLFAEDFIEELVKKYFSALYQEETKQDMVNEMLYKEISYNIDRMAYFIEKDSKMYMLTYNYNSRSGLKLKLVPEDFYNLKRNDAHHIFFECFERCYGEFKEEIKNYKSKWKKKIYKEKIIGNIYWKDNHPKLYQRDIPRFEEYTTYLRKVRNKIREILSISLKSVDKTLSKIMELYEELILENNEGLIITIDKSPYQKKYAVTKDSKGLKFQEITYSLIENDLERIINQILPIDFEYLVNRIYNYFVMPLATNLKPYMRINQLTEKSVSVTVYLESMCLLAISDQELKNWYTFVKLKYDEGENLFEFPTTSSPYKGHILCCELSPEEGVKQFKRLNSDMLEGVECYVMDMLNYNAEGNRKNVLYRIKNEEVRRIGEKYSLTESMVEKVRQEGIYAFYKVLI